MRRITEASGRHECLITLSEKPRKRVSGLLGSMRLRLSSRLHNIHRPTQEMSSTRQRSRPDRLQDRTKWNLDIYQIMETIVWNREWCMDNQQVISNEHLLKSATIVSDQRKDPPYLEHLLTQEVVDTGTSLRTSTMEIELQFVLRRLAQRALQSERTATMAIIVDEIDERRGLIAHVVLDDLAHGSLGPLQ